MGLDSVGSNSDADRIAERLGFRGGSHQLKADYIRSKDTSKYDMKYDKSTREIILVRKDGSAPPVGTGLIMPN